MWISFVAFTSQTKIECKTYLGIIKRETKERELLVGLSSWDNLPQGEVETLFHESFNTE